MLKIVHLKMEPLQENGWDKSRISRTHPQPSGQWKAHASERVHGGRQEEGISGGERGTAGKTGTREACIRYGVGEDA